MPNNAALIKTHGNRWITQDMFYISKIFLDYEKFSRLLFVFLNIRSYFSFLLLTKQTWQPYQKALTIKVYISLKKTMIKGHPKFREGKELSLHCVVFRVTAFSLLTASLEKEGYRNKKKKSSPMIGLSLTQRLRQRLKV